MFGRRHPLAARWRGWRLRGGPDGSARRRPPRRRTSTLEKTPDHLLRGLPPGGGVDGEFARARPGISPNTISGPSGPSSPRNMPGAGGIVLGNYINSIADRGRLDAGDLPGTQRISC